MAKKYKRICEYCGHGQLKESFGRVCVWTVQGRRVLAHMKCFPSAQSKS